MRRSKGVSTFIATLVLVGISLSLSYVVYEGVDRLAAPRQVVFSNQLDQIPGSPGLLQVSVYASSPSDPVALVADNVSSTSGILLFDGSGYASSGQLCSAGGTTFFSVYTGSGTLQTVSDGRSWIDGYWTSSLVVQPGWHEVMFSDASSCTVTNTDGVAVAYPGSDISAVPLIGPVPSAELSFYLPSNGGPHQFLLVFQDGEDQLA